MLGKEISPEIAHNWSGMFQTKFCEKIYICQSGNTWSKRIGFKKNFSLALSLVRQPYPKSEWQRAPTRAALAPASLVSFLHWKNFKGLIFAWHRQKDTSWNVRSFSQVTLPVSWVTLDYRHLHSLCLLTALVVLSAKNSHILPLIVDLELKHMGTCSAAILSLICQCRVCINAANPASGYGSLCSSLQPQE